MKCPNCGREQRIFKSRTRSSFESFAHAVTPLRVYRCHHCNWRGWVFHLTPHRFFKMSSTGKQIWTVMFTVAMALLFSYVVHALLTRGDG